jgi:2-polyprenyl-3-methyl-5-hydroxy-6-metoxy-1,4-benzoquinol methylase
MIKSKEWNWSTYVDDYWKNIADEFLPVAAAWKAKNFAKVLDLGCGIGRHALSLAKMGFSVSAFDLSEAGLAQLDRAAQEENVQIDTRLGDMLALPYETGAFDCVLAFHSIYHTDLAGLARVISEIDRVTRPDGEIFITLNSKDSDAWSLYSQRRIDEYTLLKTGGPEEDVPHTYLEYKDVMDLMRGFQILKLQQICDYWEDRKHAHFFVTAKRI